MAVSIHCHIFVKHLLTKHTIMNNVPSVAERNEILQDIIDRMLYLPESDRKQFLYYISILKDTYPVGVKLVDGIRVYEPQNK